MVRQSLAAVAACAALSAAAAGPPAVSGRGGDTEAADAQAYDTPVPPFELGLYPCTQCHTGPGDPHPRVLIFHKEEQPLHHGPHMWCLDCHDLKNRNVLHLTDGEPVTFAESYRLCGQCHGDKYRDWKVGVHGKRIGYWNGKKKYFLCVNCHNPHSPRFKGVETKMINGVMTQHPIATPTRPEPPPHRPEETR